MSVEQWKRVITLFTAAIIIGLAIATIVLGIKVSNLHAALEKDSVINLEEYAGITVEEGQRLYDYINSVDTGETVSYQKKYPGLYVDNDFSFTETPGKMAYLTFDDGPAIGITEDVLDILKKHKVKATFFVIGKEGDSYERLYKRIVDEGHTIAVHTYTHDYESIYMSVESYLTDFKRISDHIEDITGVKPELFRFPGGSVNGYNMEIYQEIIAEMLRRGFTYYDWNISSRDTVAGLSADDILRNIAYDADEMEDDIIVLMHDGEGHEETADALPRIIKELHRQGFELDALSKNVEPVCFGY